MPNLTKPRKMNSPWYWCGQTENDGKTPLKGHRHQDEAGAQKCMDTTKAIAAQRVARNAKRQAKKKMLAMRFVNGETCAQIAADYDVSGTRVNQLVREGLRDAEIAALGRKYDSSKPPALPTLASARRHRDMWGKRLEKVSVSG